MGNKPGTFLNVFFAVYHFIIGKHISFPLAALRLEEDSWTQRRGTDKDRIDSGQKQQQQPSWRGLSLDLQLNVWLFLCLSLSHCFSLHSSKGKLSLRQHQSPASWLLKACLLPDALSLHLQARLKRSPPPSFHILLPNRSTKLQYIFKNNSKDKFRLFWKPILATDKVFLTVSLWSKCWLHDVKALE